MGAFHDFLGRAARVLALLREGQALLGQAREKNAEAAGRLSAAAEGAGNPAVSASLVRLEGVEWLLGRAETESVGVAEEFREYLELIGAESAGGGSESASAAIHGPVRLKDFRPNEVHPEGRRRIVDEAGWADRNREGSVRAKGILYDAEGNPLLAGAMMRASRRGPGADTRDLREPWRSDGTYTTRTHLEGHVAAHMRRNGVQVAVLYLNLPPCGSRPYEEPDPKRCEANLASHLKPGSVLYVHSVYPNGSTRTRAYSGTGEALSDE